MFIRNFFWGIPIIVVFVCSYFAVKADPNYYGSDLDIWIVCLPLYCVGVFVGKAVCKYSGMAEQEVDYDLLAIYKMEAPFEFAALCRYINERDVVTATALARNIIHDRHIKPEDKTPALLKMYAYKGLIRVAECYYKEEKYVNNIFRAAHRLGAPEITQAFGEEIEERVEV